MISFTAHAHAQALASDHNSLRRGQSIRVGAFVTRLPANNNMKAILF